MLSRFLLTVLLGVTLLTSSGCVHAIFSGDPLRRGNQLINKSEDLRLVQDDWERFWMLDQPSHLTPYRTHGGIM
ncbi:MAG: hypothetical protein LBI05_09640 [Planctomycetaceae bacterium]|nr:hypothetical protein [Planctomycetaceae bacterium]